MRFRYVLLVSALLAAPAPLLAQGTQSAPPRAGMVHEALEARSPVTPVLRHRDAWGLSAEQVARLEEIRQRMIEQNRPLVRQMLEIRSAPGLPQGVRPQEMTPEQRREWERRVQQARPIMQQIHANNQRGMEEVRAVLTPPQREHLRQWLQERDRMRRDHDARDGGHKGRAERPGTARGRPN